MFYQLSSAQRALALAAIPEIEAALARFDFPGKTLERDRLTAVELMSLLDPCGRTFHDWSAVRRRCVSAARRAGSPFRISASNRDANS